MVYEVLECKSGSADGGRLGGLVSSHDTHVSCARCDQLVSHRRPSQWDILHQHGPATRGNIATGELGIVERLDLSLRLLVVLSAIVPSFHCDADE